jgi:hypothetical protein
MPGTTDGAPPQDYTPEQLSRVKDAVDLCKHVDTYCNVQTLKGFWAALPYNLQFDFNYSKWDYVPAR